MVWIVLLAVYFINRWLVFRSYVPVEAVVARVETDTKDTMGNSASVYSHFIYYSYSYEGTEYETKLRIFIRGGAEPGDEATLRINPKEPQKVFDAYPVKGLLAVEAFLILLWVLSQLILRGTGIPASSHR